MQAPGAVEHYVCSLMVPRKMHAPTHDPQRWLGTAWPAKDMQEQPSGTSFCDDLLPVSRCLFSIFSVCRLDEKTSTFGTSSRAGELAGPASTTRRATSAMSQLTMAQLQAPVSEPMTRPPRSKDSVACYLWPILLRTSPDRLFFSTCSSPQMPPCIPVQAKRRGNKDTPASRNQPTNPNPSSAFYLPSVSPRHRGRWHSLLFTGTNHEQKTR
ncbi:uncharacterized protein J3D65DRAFT_281711 [Phyllosticta citribraziliensis]|uniref:Uncharacterized protein n=1 Tax=Phyllosticta citribraziliensis TaxID=989973 RepID=A0ABR1LWD1_9PEZI